MRAALVVAALAVVAGSVAVAGCSGKGVPDNVAAGWRMCQATDDVEGGMNGSYAGIRPSSGTANILLETLAYVQNPEMHAITFTGVTDGVAFTCVYNSYANIAAFDWGS